MLYRNTNFVEWCSEKKKQSSGRDKLRLGLQRGDKVFLSDAGHNINAFLSICYFGM